MKIEKPRTRAEVSRGTACAAGGVKDGYMEAFIGSERSHPYAPRQPVALSQQPIGSLVAKAPEERVVRYELDLPLVAIDTHHAREAASVELEAGPVEMGVFGNEAEQRLC